jgi:hypothetical protein
MALWARKSVALGCLRVFVDQSAEDRAPSDLVNGQIGDATSWRGWPLAQRAMRPMFVVVRRVLAEDGCQMPFAGDEHAVGAFPSDGAHPTFGGRVRPRRLRRRLDDRDTRRGEYGVEGGGELRVAVAQQEPQRVCSLVELDQKIPRLLGEVSASAGRPTRRWGGRSSR